MNPDEQFQRYAKKTVREDGTALWIDVTCSLCHHRKVWTSRSTNFRMDMSIWLRHCQGFRHTSSLSQRIRDAQRRGTVDLDFPRMTRKRKEKWETELHHRQKRRKTKEVVHGSFFGEWTVKPGNQSRVIVFPPKDPMSPELDVLFHNRDGTTEEAKLVQLRLPHKVLYYLKFGIKLKSIDWRTDMSKVLRSPSTLVEHITWNYCGEDDLDGELFPEVIIWTKVQTRDCQEELKELDLPKFSFMKNAFPPMVKRKETVPIMKRKEIKKSGAAGALVVNSSLTQPSALLLSGYLTGDSSSSEDSDLGTKGDDNENSSSLGV